MAAGAAGCGGSANAPAAARQALAGYLREVEPIRLAVNRLLTRADPILEGYREHRLSPAEASRRMDTLERRFAAYAVDVAAIEPRQAALARLHAGYAGTYTQQDAYLSALSAGLAERSFDSLPDTQAAQRVAIIRWRTGLEVLARRCGYDLPRDLQQAGRGEIAPSPSGAS